MARCVSVVGLLLLVMNLPAHAITIDAVDAGYYARREGVDTGGHNPNNVNYAAGWGTTNDQFFHNFFVFDLTGVAGPITSAVLSLELTTQGQGGGYLSADASETFTVWDFSGDIVQLLAGGNNLAGIFDDLGSGSPFGSISITDGDEGTTLDITLNAAALAALNAADGLFALGGSVTTLSVDDPADPDELVFGFSHLGSPTRQLILNVPEPAALTTLCVFLGAAVSLRRYRQTG